MREILATLALAVVLSVIVDSVLIVTGFAVASNFIEGMSVDAGVICVVIMILGLLIIWPVVLIPLVVVLFADAIIRRMPVCLFVVSFSVSVTAIFSVFIQIIVQDSQWTMASLMTNPVVLVDTGIACLVSSTFAAFYKTLSARAR